MSRALLVFFLLASGCVSDPTLLDLGSGVDMTESDAVPIDVAPSDSAEALDDLAAADDLATGDDMAAAPPDLTPPADLTPAADLTPLPDLTPLVWTPHNGGLEAGNFYNVVVGDDNHLWVQTLYDVYESNDDGTTFSHVAGDTRSISAIVARGDTVYYAPSGGGVWRKTGAGAPVDLTVGGNVGTPPPLNESVILMAAPRGAAASILYAITSTPTIYRYDPANTSSLWTDISTDTDFAEGELITRVAVDDNTPDLYLSSTSGHWHWNNTLWSLDVSQGTSPNALDVAGEGPGLQKVLYQSAAIPSSNVLRRFESSAWSVAPAPPFGPDYLSIGPGFEIAACSDLGIVRLPSSSSTWQTIPSTANVYCTGVDRVPDRTVAYFSTGKGIARLPSSDNVATFSSQGVGGMTVNQFAWHPTIAGRVFAAADHGLYRSNDNGETWEAVVSGLPDTPNVLRVAIGAGTNPLIFVVAGGKLWRSLNGGDTFEDTLRTAVDVVASPTVQNQIYFCSSTGGLFASQSAHTEDLNATTIMGVTNCRHLYQYDADTLFVATDTAILRSTNAGAGSATFPLFFNRSNVADLTATSTSEVYAVAGSTMITRAVYRVTMANETKLTSPTRARAIWRTDDGDVLLGAKAGVYQRSGTSFVPLGVGLPDLDVVALRCAPGAAPRCLASAEERGSFTLR